MRYSFNALLVIVSYATCWQICAGAERWGYEEDNGPATWGNNFPLCNGDQQSPIALITDDAVIDYSLGQFSRSLFATPSTGMTLINTQHTLQVNLEDGYVIDNPALLPAPFKAAQFHLHWARPGEEGSEHTLNGKQYFGELHVVHYNTKYASLSEAASQSDGLAVLGTFIEDNYPQDNLQFDRLLNLVSNRSVRYYPDDYEYVQPFSVEAILPPDLDRYYRYMGSLTTPPCYESVVWTVFDSILQISRSQAAVLETGLFENERNVTPTIPLYGNFRPAQPLRGRQVVISPPCDRSDPNRGLGFVTQAPFVLTVISAVTSVLFLH